MWDRKCNLYLKKHLYHINKHDMYKSINIIIISIVIIINIIITIIKTFLLQIIVNKSSFKAIFCTKVLKVELFDLYTGDNSNFYHEFYPKQECRLLHIVFTVYNQICIHKCILRNI